MIAKIEAQSNHEIGRQDGKTHGKKCEMQQFLFSQYEPETLFWLCRFGNKQKSTLKRKEETPKGCKKDASSAIMYIRKRHTSRCSTKVYLF